MNDENKNWNNWENDDEGEIASQDAGRDNNDEKESYGPEYYEEIGHKGGQKARNAESDKNDDTKQGQNEQNAQPMNEEE